MRLKIFLLIERKPDSSNIMSTESILTKDGKLLQITHPDGFCEWFKYDSHEKLTHSVGSDGIKTYYDDRGVKTHFEDGASQTGIYKDGMRCWRKRDLINEVQCWGCEPEPDHSVKIEDKDQWWYNII